MDTPSIRKDSNTNVSEEPTQTSNEDYCPACLEVHPRSICGELTRGIG